MKATAGELLFLNPKKEKWRTQKGFIWRMIDSRYMYVDYAYEQSTSTSEILHSSRVDRESTEVLLHRMAAVGGQQAIV